MNCKNKKNKSAMLNLLCGMLKPSSTQILSNFSAFKPAPHHEKSVHAMLDQVVAWGGALKTLRAK